MPNSLYDNSGPKTLQKQFLRQSQGAHARCHTTPQALLSSKVEKTQRENELRGDEVLAARYPHAATGSRAGDSEPEASARMSGVSTPPVARRQGTVNQGQGHQQRTRS